MELWKIRDLRYFTCFVGGALVLALALWLFGIPPLKTLRAAFGFFLVLVLPGYFAVPVFFSKKEIGAVERLGLVLVFSIVLVTLSVMLANYFLKIPVTARNNLFIIAGVCIFFAVLGRLKKVYYKYYKIF